MANRKIGQAGLNLIKQFEGCRLTAYQCSAGVWTIGYGHTAGVYKGMKSTLIIRLMFRLQSSSTRISLMHWSALLLTWDREM